MGELSDHPDSFCLVPFGIDLYDTLHDEHLEILCKFTSLAVLPRQE